MKKSYTDYPIQEDTMEHIAPPIKEPTVLQKASYENEQKYNAYSRADTELSSLKGTLVAGRNMIDRENEEYKAIQYQSKRNDTPANGGALAEVSKRKQELQEKVAGVETQIADKEREVRELKRVWEASQRDYRALAAYAHSGAR